MSFGGQGRGHPSKQPHNPSPSHSAASLRVASALYSAFIRVTGAPTPEDLKAAKHARYLAKTAAKRRLLIRRLTR